MYKIKKQSTTQLARNTSYIGETIEEKVARIVNNKEPISDGAPIVYTERKDGVQPQYDIRTDRFEIAIDAMDAVSRSEIARRKKRIEDREEKKKTIETKTETVGEPVNTSDNK